MFKSHKMLDYWFQKSTQGNVLFLVFYTKSCSWNKCVGCILPSLSSNVYIGHSMIVKQLTSTLKEHAVQSQLDSIDKVIISNNGSVFDEQTFDSSALAEVSNILCESMPNLKYLTVESRLEYVNVEKLKSLQTALNGHDVTLELAVGFEAYSDAVRNNVFNKRFLKGEFEEILKGIANERIQIKCYFMLKPVINMTDSKAVTDIHKAIDYLESLSNQYGIAMNMHLNVTYVSKDSPLAEAFYAKKYTPVKRASLIKAIQHGKDKSISIFVGLDDEGLSVDGGTNFPTGKDSVIDEFNISNDYSLLGA